jgi:hypothetical protein
VLRRHGHVVVGLLRGDLAVSEVALLLFIGAGTFAAGFILANMIRVKQCTRRLESMRPRLGAMPDGEFDGRIQDIEAFMYMWRPKP